MYGELKPLGGGDPVPLLKKSLLVGRRESCDIVLRFANVSAHHCQLECHDGYWYVRDMNSKNGTRVNNVRVNEKRLDPGDELRVADQPGGHLRWSWAARSSLRGPRAGIRRS